MRLYYSFLNRDFGLILNCLQLSVHYVHLRVTNGADVAAHISRARGRSFNLKVNAIFGVYETCAATV